MIFSANNSVTSNPNWANLRDENGLDGAPPGHPPHVFTSDQKEKMSVASKRMWVEKRETMIKSQSLSWTEERKLEESERKRIWWTPERRQQHSKKMKGRGYPGRGKGIPKPAGFGTKISTYLTVRKKSPEHIQSMSKPKSRICRLIDRKEMSINHFTRWLKTISRLTKIG